MVLPTALIIKEEKEDFEIDAFSEPNYDVKVKVEQVASPPMDWCVDNEVFFNQCEDYSERHSEVIDYEELTEYNLLICNICKQMFLDSFSLIRHKLIHLEVRLQPMILKNQCQHIENDLMCHNGESRKTKLLHRCGICGKQMSYKVWFDHQKEVHSILSYECDLCNTKFKCKRYLKRHISYVHQGLLRKGPKNVNKLGKDLKCSQCPAVFKHKTSLHLHVKNCHCEKVRCDKCFSILKKSNLSNHMRRVHYNDGKEHKCECGKKFKSPRYLRIHIRNSNKTQSKGKTKKRQSHSIVSTV